MKKILVSFFFVFAIATFVSAQTAAANAGKNAVQATQTVNAADAQNTNITTDGNIVTTNKCSSTTKSCCMHKEAESSDASSSSDHCKSASIGMSAEKPKETAAEESEPKL